MKRVVACGLAFVCLVLWLSGCSSIFSRSGNDEATPTPAPQEIVPQRGGDMFVAIPQNADLSNPAAATQVDLVNFMSLIYETPFEYDDTGRLHSELVDTWEVSEDGQTFTFHIRDGVYFSDGTLLTARDVYDSALRSLSIETPAEAPTPEPSPTDPAASADPSALPTATRQPASASYANRFSEYNAIIESIDVEGDALVIRTSKPGSAILHFMTFPVSKGGTPGEDAALGTGPYAPRAGYIPGEQIQLETNNSWWQGSPYIERIVGVPADPRDKIDMQQTSLLDFITTSALNAGNYAIMGKSKVIDFMTDYFDCLVPNLTVPELRDPDVRRAISEAIDRREILSTVLLNHGVPSNLPIAPDSFVMDARFRTNQRDDAAALSLLGNAGYKTEENGNGRTLALSLIVPDSIDSTYKKEAARAIRKQLAEVYIEITVEELPEVEFEQRLAAGDYELAYCSYYLSTFPDLAFMLTQNGSGNYNGFSDTQVDQALEECAAAITEDEIVAAFAHLQELLNVHLPVIGLYFRMNSIICDEGIGGITGVREETLYTDIASWYALYTTRAIGSTAVPAPSAAAARQTEPENYRSSPVVAADPEAAPSGGNGTD